MKRAFEHNDEGNDPSVPNAINQWTRMDNALLTLVLSFAWSSYYELALVDHRFLGVLRSRPYWRALAFHILIPMGVPRTVLESIDIFHGLKESDPPYYVLWELVKPQVRNLGIRSSGSSPKKDCNVLLFATFKPTWEGRYPCFQLMWEKNDPRQIELGLYYISSNRNAIVGFTAVTYLGSIRRIRYIAHYDKDEDNVLYCELYNDARTRIWCGMVTWISGTCQPHEPFGRWIDAKDYVLTPLTWDLLQIEN
jgi:hypothetical protein